MLQNTFVFVDEDSARQFLVESYFHDEYYGMSSPNNRVRFVNTLKNDRLRSSREEILNGEVQLANAIRDDLAWITRMHGARTLVGVPRSKCETSYPWAKMGLKRALRRAVSANPMLSDGLDFIVRHTDTLCTHRSYWGYGGAGEGPRPGLLADTCRLSPRIAGRDILLVDDIYTPNCGIDEDAIGAVLEAGARSVVFYAIGYTVSRGRNFRRVA